MALANYSDLVSAVEDWLDRAGDAALVARIPDFIALVETKLMYGSDAPMKINPLRVQNMETSSYVDTTSGTNALTLPSDFLEMRSLYVDSPRVTLRYSTPRELYALYSSSTLGLPYYYTTEDGNLVLAPTPDAVYKLYMLYWASIPALTSSNTTNWLMTQNPDVYLFGCLMHACWFLRDVEGMQMNGTLFAEAVNGLQLQDKKRRYSGSPLIITPEYSGP
jgi:hypothetical protein